MKKTLQNAVCLDKRKKQFINKNVVSLLILSTVVTVLVTTSTIASAYSNVRDSGNALPRSIDPLLSIRMLNKTDGWALSTDSVLKTTDGGLHWQKVTPLNLLASTDIIASSWSQPQGAFLNDQDAWVAIAVQPYFPGKSGRGPTTIIVQRTTNGGQRWQHSIFPTGGSQVIDLKFLNASNGWLQTDGASFNSTNIFHTTDGGQNWKQIGNPNQHDDFIIQLGLTFRDAQNGWEGGAITLGSSSPPLDITHDGGKTWQVQSIPVLPGVGKGASVTTEPPIFFGNNGLLPVMVQPNAGLQNRDGGTTTVTSLQSRNRGIDLYMTQNGGQTWTPTKLVMSDLSLAIYLGTATYAADSQHVWSALGTTLYATSDGGQSWTKLPQPPLPIVKFSFIDLNTGWAVGNANAAGAANTSNLLHTTNGGRTWQLINYSIAGQLTANSTSVG